VRLFGRNDPSAGISAFWQWWARAQSRIRQNLDDDTGRSLAGEIAGRVKGIHRDLGWEAGKSPGGGYVFSLSCAGNWGARKVAAQWLRAAPAQDGVWRYTIARGALPLDYLAETTLQAAGSNLKVADCRLKIVKDESRERLDLSLWHPVFDRLPADARIELAFLLLDAVLGEEDVERWVGAVECSDSAGEDALPILQLPREIASMAATATGDRFALYSGVSARTNNPLILVVNSALKHIDDVEKDVLLTIEIRLLTAGAQGMPMQEELAALETAESDIDAALPGAAVVGNLMGDGARVLYRYVVSEDCISSARDSAKIALPGRRVSVAARRDPDWNWHGREIYNVFAKQR